MEYRIVGIGSGGVDTQTNEIKFELSVANAPPMSFVAEYGPLSQVMGALGRMVFELRKILAASNAMKSVAAETIATSHVQKDRWQDVVLMELGSVPT